MLNTTLIVKVDYASRKSYDNMAQNKRSTLYILILDGFYFHMFPILTGKIKLQRGL